ncbi:MAG: WecB/TagA/CpsF family glycosyltransferase [Anaerolineales bacterium]|nr:WecB/TagA/CpsF family glycosyltransferase [Anaerolineales bacterium]
MTDESSHSFHEQEDIRLGAVEFHAPRVNILGVGISAVNNKSVVEIVQGWMKTNQPQYLSVCNVHTVMNCYRDPSLRTVVNGAGIVAPDGMPLVWIGRMQGYSQMGRVYGPDLMLTLCRESQKSGYRHFFYGGAPGVPQALTDELRRRYPKLQIAGFHSPPFRPLTPREQKEDIDRINLTEPHVVWIGLGTPKQDRWVADHVGLIEGAVLIPVGAAFDFISGRLPQAPRWMRVSGLEWLFRFLTEPRRLWRRYLVDNPLFILRMFEQALGLKRYTIE